MLKVGEIDLKIGDMVIYNNQLNYHNDMTIGKLYRVHNILYDNTIDRLNFVIIKTDKNEKRWFGFDNFKKYFITLKEYRKQKLERLEGLC